MAAVLRICRFCNEYASTHNLVKYGTRHYGHFHCYLDNKPLHALPGWQVGRFPYKLLEERGLVDEARACTRRS